MAASAAVRRMQAAYDFAAEEEGEITVRKGDVVFFTDDPSTMRDGWTFVESQDGRTGFVPTDYLVDAPAASALATPGPASGTSAAPSLPSASTSGAAAAAASYATTATAAA
eukprot:CAMPEP_0203812960 /NCGR_PEP_ID=MMETSP0115-20131106/4452_1 /ASSEMBLY_ACC=CAM_ASM_000227 /TAXON_ID=33651 /ORGANISM="Bicosoecid sp, Strain ms1" /LENGTH=110 /DNA_ID=CAMNT_0050721815 /DNA_START=175 /DNA_END=504 /DNA_ORIENTATION=-